MDQVSLRASIYFGAVIAVAMFAIQKLNTVPPAELFQGALKGIRWKVLAYAFLAGALISIYEGLNFVRYEPHWFRSAVKYLFLFSWMFPLAACFVAHVGFEFYRIRCVIEELRRRSGRAESPSA